MDITYKELDDQCKTFSDLSVGQGQIRIWPGTCQNIKALYTKLGVDMRPGRNPSVTPFPVNQLSECPYKALQDPRKFSKRFKDLARSSQGGQVPRAHAVGRLETHRPQLHASLWVRWNPHEVTLSVVRTMNQMWLQSLRISWMNISPADRQWEGTLLWLTPFKCTRSVQIWETIDPSI
jgi:hypothetical protein